MRLIEVDEDGAGQRLDNFLMRHLKGVPKTHVYRIIRSGEVRINKGRCQADSRVEAGDVGRVPPVRISEKVQEKADRPAPAREFPILFEDEHLIAIDKPAGVAVHGGSGVSFGVIEQLRQARPQAKFLELVHRLDRETSGIMMYAKDEKTQHTLRDNWHDIVRDRRYVAVVMGEMEKDQGRVQSWLTDRKLYVSSSPVDDGGKLSITHYATIKRANGFSLIELQLETGRKNQIRVHMRSLGHPLVGDERYGCEINPLGRLALHAFKLCFYHPVTGEWMEFETPYPASFKTLMLRK